MVKKKGVKIRKATKKIRKIVKKQSKPKIKIETVNPALLSGKKLEEYRKNL